MAKGPSEGDGNGDDKGAEVIELFPPASDKPTVADAKAAGLDRAETLVALMRGKLKLPGKDESLDGGRPNLDMARSRRIIDPDGKLIGIGSLFQIEERVLEATRKAVGNKRKPPSHTGGSDAAR